MTSGPEIAERLVSIGARIAAAAKTAGRQPSEITLVAVSKTVPPPHLLSAIGAGQMVFGENRVQEAASKWPLVRAASGGACGTAFANRRAELELHLIGPLQTNKLPEALELFDVIETLDRERLAEALVAAQAKGAIMPRLFIQVNTGRETQKAGIAPEAADDFIGRCRDGHKLKIEGLMCIPPVEENPEPHFLLLRDIAERNGLQYLSCGMSGDFETAIACGATHVRIGSALFGARS